MRMTQKELGHLVFLSEVILENNKRTLMPDMLQSLLFIVKTLPEADVTEEVGNELQLLVSRIENELKYENVKLQEIRHNLAYPKTRNPFG